MAQIFVVGLTGDIASGKSTVAALLTKKGALVLDADVLVQELYADKEFAKQVASLFAVQVLLADGTVNRAALGQLVFEDATSMARLEALVHPAVASLRDRKVAAYAGQVAADPMPIVVYEAVKLLESGHGRSCEAILCVTSSPGIQLRRLMENRGLAAAEARERLAAQPSREAKEHLAQGVPLFWIPNNGTLEQLEAQVERTWTQLTSIPQKGGSLPRPRPKHGTIKV